MRRALACVLGAAFGYVALAVVGYWAIELLSSNRHDRSVEAAMTAAFVAGPLGAVAGLIAGLIFGRKKTPGA